MVEILEAEMSMVDVDEQTVQENFCEACKGYPGGNCTNNCDGFKIAFLMCELGLDEDWDWCVPYKCADEKSLLAALRLVKKTLIDVKRCLNAMKPVNSGIRNDTYKIQRQEKR